MLANIESFHASCLSEMVEFANGVLNGDPELGCLICDGDKYSERIDKEFDLTNGPEPENGETASDYGVDLAIRSQFTLPGGSAELINKMARSSFHSLVPREIDGKPVPEMAFALAPLLMASFPKNTRTGIFWNNAGGTLSPLKTPSMETLEQWETDALVFAGLGVILMDQARMALNPMASDEEVIQLAENFWLGIYD